VYVFVQGYLDPEYFTTQQLSEKSDVYSFGIVLLELITARPPIQGGKYVVRLVKAALESGGISGLQEEVMDPLLRKSANTDPLAGFEWFLSLALSCVEESGSERPSMREVVKELESIVEMGSGFSADSMPPRRDDFVKTGRSPLSYYTQDMESSNSSGNVPGKESYSDLFDYSGAYTVSRTVQPK
jgi:serine/threonine protein kinase